MITERTIDNGHSSRFSNKYFLPVQEDGSPVYYPRGTKGLVIQAFDGNLFVTINNNVYALDEIPEHEHRSKHFDLPEPVKKPKKHYIPPMTHPWKSNEFLKHVSAQRHREIPDGITFEDLWYTDANYS